MGAAPGGAARIQPVARPSSAGSTASVQLLLSSSRARRGFIDPAFSSTYRRISIVPPNCCSWQPMSGAPP